MESPSFGEWSAAHGALQTTGAAQDHDRQHANDVTDYAGQFRDGGDMLLRQAIAPASAEPIPCSPILGSTSGGSSCVQYEDPDDEFLDPVTGELIVDPVIGSDGNTYDRRRSHYVVRLAHCFLADGVQAGSPGKQEPCAGGTVFLGPDNLHLRRRLRRAHPGTEAAMHKRREECIRMGRTAVDAEDYDAALYWFELVRTWAPTSLQAEVDACKAVGAAPGLTEEASTDSADHRVSRALNEARRAKHADPEDMIRVCDRAVSAVISPRMRELALILRGEAHSELHQWEAALLNYNRALRIKPDSVGALAGRAHAYSGLRNHQAALGDCDAAVRMATGETLVRALTSRASVKVSFKDDKGALEDYSAAVAADPMRPFALRCRGLFKLQNGDLQGAIADLRAVLQLSPDDAGAADAVHEAWLRQRH